MAFLYTAVFVYITINKKSIVDKIKNELSEKLNGNVQIGNISIGFLNTFPRFSVLIEKISIKDTLYNQHHHPFFEAAKIYATVSISGIIEKTSPIDGIKVENGQLYVYTDSTGYTNAYLFSPKKNKTVSKDTASKNIENNIDLIKLQQVRLVLNDEKKRKLYDFNAADFNCNIKISDSILEIKAKSNILIHNLAFNTAAGSYLKEAKFAGNLKLLFNKITKTISFNDLEVAIQDHPFKISGAFYFTNAPSFSLKVSTDNIDFNVARNLLTKKISAALSIIKFEKPVTRVSAQVSGPLNGGEPLVNAAYTCNENNVKSPYADFTNCSFSGSFTNQLAATKPREDSNSGLHFQNFKGDWEGLTVNSKNIYINNLEVPVISADIKTDFNLTQLNTLLASSALDFHEGKGLLDITYSGPLQENTNQNTLLNGKLTFSDGILMYHPRDIELKNVNGNILFKNSDVYVSDLSGNVQGNKVVMNGSGKSLLALMKTNPGRMFVDWNIYSPSLNLASFASLLKKREATAVKKSKFKYKIGNHIDEIISQANFHVDLKTDELKFKRFTATNVKASLGLADANWTLNNVSLNQGGGSMVLSGSLNEKNDKYYDANVKADMQNVDVNKVFYAFDNFGQNGITSENVRGKLTSTINMKMDIDRNLEGKPQNMQGFVDFSLKKGALLNYDPLLQIQKIAFKNRNLNEVYFAELKDRFDIKGQEIIINRMEIESTALTLFVEGIYSLRGNTDISIQVPLKNIKKRDEDYTPENKGANSDGGASVYIRGRPGDDGKIKFKLDLFKKFRKDPVKEKSSDGFKE